MASSLKKMGAWLGLVPGDDYLKQDDATEEVTVTSGATNVTGIDVKRKDAPALADLSRIAMINPHTFNEAKEIGENFRDGVPVIMNLSEMTDNEARRLVDFAAGLIFGLWGSIERISAKVFLLSPPNVEVAAEDKKLIADGFYNQS